MSEDPTSMEKFKEMGAAMGQEIGKALAEPIGQSMKATETRTEMRMDLMFLKGEMAEIKNMLKSTFVTQEQFTLIKNIVLTSAGMILLGFLGVLINFFINLPANFAK